ncbi:MAG: hypothetical protein AMXMBFR22_28600 [Phycisphaerae bacterium]
MLALAPDKFAAREELAQILADASADDLAKTAVIFVDLEQHGVRSRRRDEGTQGQRDKGAKKQGETRMERWVGMGMSIAFRATRTRRHLRG